MNTWDFGGSKNGGKIAGKVKKPKLHPTHIVATVFPQSLWYLFHCGTRNKAEED